MGDESYPKDKFWWLPLLPLAAVLTLAFWSNMEQGRSLCVVLLGLTGLTLKKVILLSSFLPIPFTWRERSCTLLSILTPFVSVMLIQGVLALSGDDAWRPVIASYSPCARLILFTCLVLLLLVPLSVMAHRKSVLPDATDPTR